MMTMTGTASLISRNRRNRSMPLRSGILTSVMMQPVWTGRDLEECSSGIVSPHVNSGRTQLEGEHLPDRLVIVDHVDDGLVRLHR